MRIAKLRDNECRSLWLPDDHGHLAQLVAHQTPELTILLQDADYQMELYNGLEAARLAPFKAELTWVRQWVKQTWLQADCDSLQKRAGFKARPVQVV